MPKVTRGHRLMLRSCTLLALLATTCRSTSYFSLDHHGVVPLSQNATTLALVPDDLTHVALAKHPLMQSQGLVLADVTEATLTAAYLTIDAPQTGSDMAFFGGVDLVLTAVGMQPITVASADAFAAGLNLVPLTLKQPLITGYLKGLQPTFHLEARYANPVPQNVSLGVHLLTEVRVGQPSGSCQN